MKNKGVKLLILIVFVTLFIGTSVWMYNKYVKPNSPYNTEIELRGMD